MEKGLVIDLIFLAQEFKNRFESKHTKYSSINTTLQHINIYIIIIRSNSI